VELAGAGVRHRHRVADRLPARYVGPGPAGARGLRGARADVRRAMERPRRGRRGLRRGGLCRDASRVERAGSSAP
jgi:hypothetical protein